MTRRSEAQSVEEPNTFDESVTGLNEESEGSQSLYSHFKLRKKKTSILESKTEFEKLPAITSPIEWKFSQVKGTSDENITDADIISTVQFNDTGELLATGDKGGRIVIFKRDNDSTSEYNVYSTFQSHEPEFDYLKSLEIEEKINKIRWLPRKNASHFLLSTNDKTIKLWKISEKNKQFGNFNFKRKPGSAPFLDSDLSDETKMYVDDDEETELSSLRSLKVPKSHNSELMIESYPKKIYANAHAYHINSVSVNSDNMTFLSADDLRINVWNLENTNQSFNIVDIKPNNMEDLAEVITSAEFHPTHCNVFVYSSSRGTIRLCDMRDQALCDDHKFTLEQPSESSERSFFSEIISSISDISFSPCGRYILSRDYQTVKLWDLVMTGRGPVDTFAVHDHLNQKLCTLYENDCIFDKFEVCWSPDCSSFMTGTYNNLFRIGSLNGSTSTSAQSLSNLYQASIDMNMVPSRRNESVRPILAPKKVNTAGMVIKRKRNEIQLSEIDYTKKVLHSAWHPKEHIIAIAATNRLLIYDSKDELLT